MVRPCEYSSLYIIWQANEPYFTGILQQGVYKRVKSRVHRSKLRRKKSAAPLYRRVIILA